jgi:hypothetical protein
VAAGNLPDVVVMLLCEAAAYDLNSDSWVLVRPLHDIRVPSPEDFPYELVRAALYFQMIDAFGDFESHYEIRNTRRTGILGFHSQSKRYTLKFPANRSLVEDVIHLPAINFLEEGEYEFQLYAYGKTLSQRGAVHLNVRGSEAYGNPIG